MQFANQKRVPPHSKEAEIAVLGCILLNNEALLLIQDIIEPDDFYIESHRTMYKCVQKLFASNSPIDHVTLGTELMNNGQLDEIGGPMALNDLTSRVSTVANVKHYAQTIVNKSLARKMIKTSHEVMVKGYDSTLNINEYLDNSQSSISEVSNRRSADSYVKASEALKPAFEELEHAASVSDTVTGITSGFGELDHKTSGLQKSDLVIIAGRPSMGKTSFALNIAYNAAYRANKPVLVFSLEMSTGQLIRRMLSSEGRVAASKIRTPNTLGPEDWRLLSKTAEQIHKVPIYLDDSPNINTISIRSKALRLKSEKGLGMIVIDYLQLMSSASDKRGNREQEISEISRTLKILAKELDVPILALSQLNRSLESRQDRRPVMSDLRESGAIEQDADMIMFVYREEVYEPETPERGVAEIIISKQRSGPIGTIRLSFNDIYTRFDNL